MRRLTKSEAISNHRKMWNWIADETLKQKRKVDKIDYFERHRVEVPCNECYCCEYGYGDDNCPDCPIEWGGEYGTCNDRVEEFDNKGLYALWYNEFDYSRAAELAKQIAELPERK